MDKKESSAPGDMGALAVGPSVPEAPVADESAVVGAAVVLPCVEEKGKAPADEKGKAPAVVDLAAPAVAPSAVVGAKSVADESAVVGVAVVGKPAAEEKGKAPATEEEGTASAAGEKRTAEVADLAEEDAGDGADAVDNAMASPEPFFGPDDEGYYDGKEYEYNYGDSKNSADDVDGTNYKSYMQHQKIKLEAGQLVLTNARGEFRCPFCSSKRFKQANRASLEMHALSLRGDAKTIKGRAEHLALAHYMLGPNLPPIGQRSQKKKRKFYRFTTTV